MQADQASFIARQNLFGAGLSGQGQIEMRPLGDKGFTRNKEEAIEKLKQKAEEFEAVFISEMLRPMFKEIGADSLFGGGPAEDTFKSLLIDEYGKVIAKGNSIGVADQVLSQLISSGGLDELE